MVRAVPGSMTVSAATTVRARASGTASVDARGSAGVATSDEAQAANARRRSADFCMDVLFLFAGCGREIGEGGRPRSSIESRNRLLGNACDAGAPRKKQAKFENCSTILAVSDSTRPSKEQPRRDS